MTSLISDGRFPMCARESLLSGDCPDSACCDEVHLSMHMPSVILPKLKIKLIRSLALG